MGDGIHFGTVKFEMAMRQEVVAYRSLGFRLEVGVWLELSMGILRELKVFNTMTLDEGIEERSKDRTGN